MTVFSAKSALRTSGMHSTTALLVGAILLGTSALPAQPVLITGVAGIEFVLINPGTMRVGHFAPVCPKAPGAGASSASAPSVTTAAGRGGANAFADARSQWDSSDYAHCEVLVARDYREGFIATIAQPFFIGKYEITQAQWTRVMGSNPSFFQGVHVKDDAAQHPVDNVTWSQAKAFVAQLNVLDRSAHYRLPTELEWEYAARAGAADDLAWTDIRESAWEQDIDKGTTHAIGGKKPNAWGLYDTLGNVWEWVEDLYNEQWFPDSVPPRRGAVHVLRGGSFLTDVKNTTYFTHAGGPGSGFDVGLRVLREIRANEAR